MQMFKRMLQAFRRRSTQVVATISFDAADVSCASGSLPQGSIAIRWDAVDVVIVYKRDCFAVDQVRLALVTSEYEYTFTEDDAGWQSLVDALPSVLPGAIPFAQWYVDVIFPAFATNMTVIYDRHRPGRQGRMH